ncbi:MAG: ribosome silencing factor [Lachnospiraceae bacterium]|nr:ribosome silencing factor [Lachnospiraceae bacterium]
MEEGKQRSAELARLAIGALEDKKAEDVRVIDIGGVSVLADYFIIASGNNRAQVQAMADEVEQRMGRAGAAPRQIEGYQAGNWVLMDFGDVIIHIFDAQNRLFYDLERIWKDGTQIDPEQL